MDFESTKYSNLIKSKRTGVYFVRAKVGGKPIRASLNTKDPERAQTLRDNRLRLERARIGKVSSNERGEMTLRDLADLYLEQVKLSVKRKENTKEFMGHVVEAVLMVWPSKNTLVKMISEGDCLLWANAHSDKYSATRYNAAVDNLRAMFELAVKIGVRTWNPAEKLEKATVHQKALKLPSKEEFTRLLDYLDERQAVFTRCDAGDIVRFLAFSGARREEAEKAQWVDVDFEREQITLTGKRDKTRRVPMISGMKDFLKDLKKRNNGKSILRRADCRAALKSACSKLGISYVTHHDFRHLFATRCIESGVDIPTVARWLGHADGGALAMRTYGHLRDDHSKAMALKVSF